MHSSNRVIRADRLEGAVPFQLRDLENVSSDDKRDDAATQTTADWRSPTPAASPAAAANDEALAKRYELAIAQGFAKGIADAQAQNEVRAQQEIAQQVAQQIAQAAQHIDQLLGAAQQAIHEFEEGSAQRVLDLAVLLANQLLVNRMDLDAKYIIPIVEQCLQAKAYADEPAMLLLNPADCDSVRAGLASVLATRRVDLVADLTVAKGGCRLVSASGAVDASLASRWRTLLRSIGLERNIDDLLADTDDTLVDTDESDIK